jgi:hypothetical protein
MGSNWKLCKALSTWRQINETWQFFGLKKVTIVNEFAPVKILLGLLFMAQLFKENILGQKAKTSGEVN